MQLKVVLLFSLLMVTIRCGKKAATGSPGGGSPAGAAGTSAAAGGAVPKAAPGGGAPPPAGPAPAGGKRGGGGASASLDMKKEDRKSVPVAEAKLTADASAVNVQSASVPDFDSNDNTFTTLYPMTCGEKVDVIPGVKGTADCSPDSNDIVVIRQDDSVTQEYCLRVFACNPGTGNQMCDVNSIRLWLPQAKKIVTPKKITPHEKAALDVKKGEIVYTFDRGCLLSFHNTQGMRHRFQNKPPGIRKMMAKYPGFYLLPVQHTIRRKYKGGNYLTIGENIHRGKKPLKKIQCNAQCDEGQMHYFKMDANAPFYGRIMLDGGKCEWMRACLKGAQGVKTGRYFCYDGNLVNVFVRNGIIVMPGAPNGAAMRLTKSVSGRSHGANVSRPTQIGFDFDGQRFSIWSVNRERVASTTKFDHDGHIIFYFSNHDCLIKKFGIQNMGLQNGVVIQIDPKKPVDNVSRGKGNAVTYAPAPTRASLPTMQTEEPTVNASAEAKPTTTEKRDVGSIIEQGGYENIKARKGWLIWAIFYGFFCGSLVALVLAVLVLYFGRRAFYADWYRGMYKRYGCDASGVSGGVTGSQFGTGTTGTGGMSTIGSTTAGTTGGSTMGTTGGGTTGGSSMGTTGGGTTGGGTTGGGESMVTM
ncbi:hypothetical protein Q1695_013912 [Nippostrongylus brasiliensis]|nr:hypothetical protein Q1695_013912 [Nippostrongylus brasiliensis]